MRILDFRKIGRQSLKIGMFVDRKYTRICRSRTKIFAKRTEYRLDYLTRSVTGRGGVILEAQARVIKFPTEVCGLAAPAWSVGMGSRDESRLLKWMETEWTLRRFSAP
jgi:hypothetical protein